MNNEIWKDVEWYEWIYKVSNLWNVYSHYSKKYNFFQNQRHNKLWYCQINLWRYWKRKNFFIHRLVAQAFIPNQENKPQVNHINWVKTDNRVENLEWLTASENIRHAFKNWLMTCNFPIRFWKNNPTSKGIIQLSEKWVHIKIWDCVMDVERNLWIKNSNIVKCLKWKRNFAWWFKWEYLERMVNNSDVF